MVFNIWTGPSPKFRSCESPFRLSSQQTLKLSCTCTKGSASTNRISKRVGAAHIFFGPNNHLCFIVISEVYGEGIEEKLGELLKEYT